VASVSDSAGEAVTNEGDLEPSA